MKLDNIETTPKQFSRQVKAYEKAGLNPDMEAQLPFVASYDYIFNNPKKTAHEVFIELGIDGYGFARQSDQVLVENIGNNLAQRIKSAEKKGTDLPDQSVVDEMVAAYDFTGARATSEEGMSTEERTVIAEIKKAIRRLISGGAFANLDASSQKTTDQDAVAFNAVRVQTGPEAKGDKETPAGSVPLDNFDEVVAAAYTGSAVEFEDGNGNSATLDFSVEPSINKHGQATNLTGVIELARREAARTLERNRTKTAPLTVDVQIG